MRDQIAILEDGEDFLGKGGKVIYVTFVNCELPEALREKKSGTYNFPRKGETSRDKARSQHVSTEACATISLKNESARLHFFRKSFRAY